MDFTQSRGCCPCGRLPLGAPMRPYIPAGPPPTPPCGEGIDCLPLAMAYIPIQSWQATYEPETALRQGTIFPALDLPFLATGRCRR
ncbi:MAG: spore coat associated protein CotJA [Oscillospiraceae bacterium]